MLLASACVGSKTPDPRCTIEAEGVHREWIAKEVNTSKLWKAYFKARDPSNSRKLVKFELSMERKRLRSFGGDYDPGKVIVTFDVSNLENRRALYQKKTEVDLQPFMVGFFDENATRDEIQEVAFKATEKDIKPFLARWIDLAALRAMGQQGSGGQVFVPLLEELLADEWTTSDLEDEAGKALSKIRGR